MFERVVPWAYLKSKIRLRILFVQDQCLCSVTVGGDKAVCCSSIFDLNTIFYCCLTSNCSRFFLGFLHSTCHQFICNSVSQHSWHCAMLCNSGLVHSELVDVSCRSPVLPKSMLKQGQLDWLISLLLLSQVITFIFLCCDYNQLSCQLMDSKSLFALALGLILCCIAF